MHIPQIIVILLIALDMWIALDRDMETPTGGYAFIVAYIRGIALVAALWMGGFFN